MTVITDVFPELPAPNNVVRSMSNNLQIKLALTCED